MSSSASAISSVRSRSTSRASVDCAHVLALEHGCSNAGAPGLRPGYHAHYYGAYFRDPDGNKLCVVCHDAPLIAESGR